MQGVATWSARIERKTTMQNSLVIAAGEAPHVIPARWASFVKIAGARVAAAFATRKERRELLMLDKRMLADIGLTLDDVKRETSRNFWDAR